MVMRAEGLPLPTTHGDPPDLTRSPARCSDNGSGGLMKGHCGGPPINQARDRKANSAGGGEDLARRKGVAELESRTGRECRVQDV
jgi:hypothetical protein